MTTRGQLPKAYLRIDPNIDRHKADTQWAFIRLLCEANRQPRRGRFKSRAYFDGLMGKAAAKRLLVAGDAIEMGNGEVLVPGWEEWQEGDVTVAERQRRIRQRRDEKVEVPQSRLNRDALLTESVDIRPISTASSGNGVEDHEAQLAQRYIAVTSPLPDRIPTPAATTPKGSKARRGEAKSSTDERGSPPARAKASSGRAAGTSSGRRRQKAPDDRPDLAAYADRGWRWSDAQADSLVELAVQLEVSRDQGLATLAEWIRTAPADVPDLHGYILELGNRTRAERLAKADADDAAWQETKARYDADAGPLAAEVAAGLGSQPLRNGHAVEHAKAIAMLRQLRGTVADGPWHELLARYAVTEEELDATAH